MASIDQRSQESGRSKISKINIKRGKKYCRSHMGLKYEKTKPTITILNPRIMDAGVTSSPAINNSPPTSSIKEEIVTAIYIAGLERLKGACRIEAATLPNPSLKILSYAWKKNKMPATRRIINSAAA